MVVVSDYVFGVANYCTIDKCVVILVCLYNMKSV